jgi:hypothetical protein
VMLTRNGAKLLDFGLAKSGITQPFAHTGPRGLHATPTVGIRDASAKDSFCILQGSRLESAS